MNWIAEYPFQVVVFAQVLTSVAYGMTIYSSAIKSIPENQFRAARVDGAGEWEIIRQIILPNLKPHISFIILWESLGLLTNYTAILLITDERANWYSDRGVGIICLSQSFWKSGIWLWCSYFPVVDCSSGIYHVFDHNIIWEK